MKHTIYISSIFLLFLSFLNLHNTLYSTQNPVVLVIGTRPEAIKMMPVYKALKELEIPTLICSTGQHSELLDDSLALFDIKPDRSLNIMKPGQDLFHITTAVLNTMKEFLLEVQPSLVLVQGDTTSAMAAALAAFYLKIPIGHVEAGLRTYNMQAPYPEEMNRQFISLIATYHFAPTQQSAQNLINSHASSDTIFCVGNTVVDALYMIKDGIHNNKIAVSPSLQKIIDSCKAQNKKLMLLTAHRRESFNGGLKQIFSAIKTSLESHPDLFVIYPMHPNPAIKEIFKESGLDTMPNILVSKPLGYTDLVYILDEADLIATDSGGIQEEGVSLGKPVLVLRNETDRPEGILAGIAQLVGTNQECIIQKIDQTLTAQRTFTTSNVYGDGTASRQIAYIIQTILNKENK